MTGLNVTIVPTRTGKNKFTPVRVLFDLADIKLISDDGTLTPSFRRRHPNVKSAILANDGNNGDVRYFVPDKFHDLVKQVEDATKIQAKGYAKALMEQRGPEPKEAPRFLRMNTLRPFRFLTSERPLNEILLNSAACGDILSMDQAAKQLRRNDLKVVYPEARTGVMLKDNTCFFVTESRDEIEAECVKAACRTPVEGTVVWFPRAAEAVSLLKLSRPPAQPLLTLGT